jgi:CRP-like cAMP-binding protein
MRLFSQNVKVEALRRAPLFEGLSKKELGELARVTEDLKVRSGTVLCREGRIGREFFVIVDGSANVTKGGTRIGDLSGGDFVGEIALLTTKERTATVTASSEIRCFVLRQEDFRRVLEASPRMQHKVMEALGDRLLADVRR